jgi:uncharacterized protein YggE
MKFASFFVAAALMLAPALVSAQETAAAPEPTLTVTGHGVVEKSPNVARVALQIVTDDDVAALSTSKNGAVYAALQAKLAPLGLTPDALRTTFFNVQFIRHPPRGLPPDQLRPHYGYVTTRGLSVEVAPIENAGKVIDAATAAGVTDVGGVSYDLKDSQAAYRAALAGAASDARANAEALATAGGVHLIRLQTMSAEPQPDRFQPALEMARAAAAPTDLGNPGPIEISATVTLTYAVK